MKNLKKLDRNQLKTVTGDLRVPEGYRLISGVSLETYL
ncbi:bacteriocin-like protein [Chryseobacterium sp. SN22]